MQISTLLKCGAIVITSIVNALKTRSAYSVVGAYLQPYITILSSESMHINEIGTGGFT